jgi:hypothetical protein
MIFQCPLSPSGTFQPVKSLPLNNARKPGGGTLSFPGCADMVFPQITIIKTTAAHIIITTIRFDAIFNLLFFSNSFGFQSLLFEALFHFNIIRIGIFVTIIKSPGQAEDSNQNIEKAF